MIREIFLNFAVCSVLATVYEWIVPPKTKETFRSVAAILLIAVTVLPLFQNDYSELNRIITEWQTKEESTAENGEYDILVGEVKRKIYSDTEKTLISCGVTEYEIYVTATYVKEENTVVLSQVKTVLPKAEIKKCGEIQKQLFDLFGEVSVVEVKNE